MIKKDLKYDNYEIRRILNSEKLVIYGAGTMGKAVYKCLTEDPYNLVVECFIVKNLENNDRVIYSVPVIDIDHASEYRDATILIALNGKFIPEVINDLKEAGFSELLSISFDGDLWTAIRGNWIRENRVLSDNIAYLSDMFDKRDNSSILENFLPNRFYDRFHLYVVHSIFDRELSRKVVEQPYEIEIQVGSALTDRVLFDVRDDTGDDIISEKNKQYCELTGIYWAWKNESADYVGFSHYRRRFFIPDEQLKMVFLSDIDVVVTEPLLNFETVRGQYARDHCKADWDTFMEVIKEMASEYYPYAQQVQNAIYYYAYNMFIMKKEVFREYCSFIFPILNKCERLIGAKEDVYQNRYIGFLAERLLTIFLMKNTYLKVAVADKTFLD